MWRILALGLVLAQSAGSSVSGSVVLVGTAPTTLSKSARVIFARSDDGQQFVKASVGLLPMNVLAGGDILPDKSFVVDNLAPGTYFPMAAFVPQPWKLVSAQYDGRDVAEEGLTIGTGIASGHALTLTFSDRPTAIWGEIHSPAGAAVPGDVVAFPQNRQLWPIAGRRQQRTSAGADGRYMIHLDPGHYYLVAAPHVDAGQLFDPAYLEKLSQHGIVIVVTDGHRTSMNLSLAPETNLAIEK